MNFESGTSLAEFQDRLIKQYQEKEDLTLTPAEYERLNGNQWVALATHFGPNNLVIRHRCLQGIFGNKEYREEILGLFGVLAPGLWAEGYSYWKYTKSILASWGALYYPEIMDKIKIVDSGFTLTSYVGVDGKLWPAPFGDLRKEPLEEALQNGRRMDYSSAPVAMKIVNEGAVYKIKPYPLGGNTHVPIKVQVINVKNGVPEGFKFYEGYDKKYPNGFAEFLDIIRPIRIFSLFKMRGV